MKTQLRRILLAWLTTLIVAGALPALAHNLGSAAVTANCASFTLTVTGNELTVPTGTVNYEVILTPNPGAPVSVTGAITVTPNPDGTFTGSVTRTWSSVGVTLSGTTCISGSATLVTQNGTHNTVKITSTPECVTCTGKCAGSIGDFVWHDLDFDAHQGGSEPGIANVTLRLIDGTDHVIRTTHTDGSGAYLFDGLCADSYQVEVDTPPGYVPTTPCSPDQTVPTDSNCSAAPVTLTTNDSHNPTIDFGFVTPSKCSGLIGDFVWRDTDCDGIQDFGEPGLNGVRVSLKNDGVVVRTTTTSQGPNLQDGYYQFNEVCQGSYTVEVDGSTLPAGAIPAPCTVGSNRAIDNNCSPAPVSLSSSESSDTTIDFGYCVGVGKTFTIGPSSMEGHLRIMPGDWISGGFSFKFKSGSHAATQFTVKSKVEIAVTCPLGGGAGGTILVDLGTKAYSVPAANTSWLPTGDANSVLSWMGSAQAPNLCGGKVMDNARGAVYTSTVSQNPVTGTLVDFRFKYRDPNAKGKGNVNCLDTSDPRRAKADVCGASWSETVLDP
jgi:hypothetical protein